MRIFNHLFQFFNLYNNYLHIQSNDGSKEHISFSLSQRSFLWHCRHHRCCSNYLDANRLPKISDHPTVFQYKRVMLRFCSPWSHLLGRQASSSRTLDIPSSQLVPRGARHRPKSRVSLGPSWPFWNCYGSSNFVRQTHRLNVFYPILAIAPDLAQEVAIRISNSLLY